MFWTKKLLSEKLAIALSLFLIGSLHTMIFAFFSYPSNFLVDEQGKAAAILLKTVLYGAAITVSLNHHFLCRSLGLRHALMAGLTLNLLGLTSLWTNQFWTPHLAFLFFTMFVFGIALTSVMNSLITYLVIEIPKNIGASILILFAFFNIGSMMAPLMIHTFKKFDSPHWIYLVLASLLLLAIYFVQKVMQEPVYPHHLRHLRKGTLIWKELHYRMGLFFLSLVGYGFSETTFALWGFQSLATLFSPEVAEKTVSIFWLFLIIGQISLLIPIFIFSVRWLYFVLLFFSAVILYLLADATTLNVFVALFMIGGFCCSINSPLLLAIMEREITLFAKGKELLPYIETTVSVLLAGYFLGVGIIDLWLELYAVFPVFPIRDHFYFAIPFIGVTALFSFYLMLTRPKKRGEPPL